jgi:hypothetical protein
MFSIPRGDHGADGAIQFGQLGEKRQAAREFAKKKDSRHRAQEQAVGNIHFQHREGLLVAALEAELS